MFDFIDNKQYFTLQHCPKTHSIKCYISVHKDEVKNESLYKQRWNLLQMLDKMVHSVHKRFISTAKNPIAYIECPLQHNEESGFHLHLDKIKPNMYCNKVYPKQLVPKETYNLLLPMDQLGEYEQCKESLCKFYIFT